MMHRTIKIMITLSMLFHHGIGMAMNPVSRTTLAIAKTTLPQLRSSLVANLATDAKSSSTDTKSKIIQFSKKSDIGWKKAFEAIEKNDTPRFKSLIVKLHPEHLMKQNELDRDLLFTTVFEGRKDMARILLEAGVNPNTENYSWVYKVTPLMKAVAYGGHASQPHDTMHLITQLLIGYGADLNKVDADNRTALYYAVSKMNLEAVELLNILGADQSIKGKDYQLHKDRGVCVNLTPYELAMDRLNYCIKELKHNKDRIEDIEVYYKMASKLKPKDEIY